MLGVCPFLKGGIRDLIGRVIHYRFLKNLLIFFSIINYYNFAK